MYRTQNEQDKQYDMYKQNILNIIELVLTSFANLRSCDLFSLIRLGKSSLSSIPVPFNNLAFCITATLS